MKVDEYPELYPAAYLSETGGMADSYLARLEVVLPSPEKWVNYGPIMSLTFYKSWRWN